MPPAQRICIAHTESPENIVPTLHFGAFDLAAAVSVSAERMAIESPPHSLRNAASDVVRLVVTTLQSSQRVLRHGHNQIDLIETLGAGKDQPQPLA